MGRIKLTISIPEALDEYIRGRMESGGFGSVSEYFRQLVRGEQIRIDEIRFQRTADWSAAPAELNQYLRRDGRRY